MPVPRTQVEVDAHNARVAAGKLRKAMQSTLPATVHVASSPFAEGPASDFEPPKRVETPLNAQIDAQAAFVIHGKPVGKPRMTQSDRWKKRPAVLRYREFCDRARAAAGEVPARPMGIHVATYVGMPASWSKRKRAEMDGKPHRQKPDGDNLLKSVCDALLDDDSCLYLMTVRKFWCPSGFDRVCVEWVLDGGSPTLLHVRD